MKIIKNKCLQVHPDCPVHRAAESLACTCSESLSVHCKSKNLPQQHCWFVDTNKEDTPSESQSECNNIDGNKKIENCSKSTKLKCNCGITNKTREKQIRNPEKTIGEVKNCSQHSQEGRILHNFDSISRVKKIILLSNTKWRSLFLD